jgi:hypothetical protein
MAEHASSSTLPAAADPDRTTLQPSWLERLDDMLDVATYGVATVGIFALITIVTPARIALRLFREGNNFGTAGVIAVMTCVYGLAIRDATRRRWSWASKFIAAVLLLSFLIVLGFDMFG